MRALLLTLLAVAVLTDHASLPLLVVVVFLVGVAGCFFDPAAQAAIPMVVGRDPDSLARANGRLWSLDLVGRSLIGPPVGAALFAVAAALPFVVNAGTFVISALLLTGLGALASPALAGSKERVHSSVREGISFLVHHPELRALTIGMASFNLAYNIAFAPLVLFAQDRLHLGERGFGLLLAMVAVGGLIGAWVAPRIGRRITSLQAYALGLALQGLAWGSIGLWPHRWVAGSALAVIGGASMIVTVIGASARQSLTPDALLGRVSAGTRTLGLGAAGVGALAGGLIGNAWGLQAPFIASTGLALASGGYFLAIRAKSSDDPSAIWHPSR